ncbi:MAG: GNAT family N-acetyltransferase [Candidatus Brocadiaceae bacterium]|nr:GNAT family N-acetyltransferase [Candidatus Brocadiaceae bacterium]
MPDRSEGVLILYNVPLNADGVDDAPCAEADAGVLDQVRAVGHALEALGVPFRSAGVRTLGDLPRELATAPEAAVFNLVEALRGDARDFTLVPALCAAFGKACTGGDTFCLVHTLDKWQAKAALRAAGVPVPDGVLAVAPMADATGLPGGPLIVKPCRAEASEGIDADSVFEGQGAGLDAAVERVCAQFGCPALVERFLSGREVNVSVLQRGASTEVLPLAEIEFVDFPPEAPRIVGYRAKWLADSAEFRNTPRRIPADLPEATADEVRRQALRAWEALGCRDFARVDFRLDRQLRPHVLEVNANPDLSPDGGFAAALAAASIPFEEFVRVVLENARRRAARTEGRVQAAPGAPGGVRIRCSRPDDRAAIAAIAVETRVFRPEEVAVACEVLDDALAQGPEGDYRSFTAEVGGRPAGWVCFGPTPCTQATYDIYWIMVAPWAQGTGAGRALIAHAEDLIARSGGRLAVVEASGGPPGDRARGFYVRVGYEEAGRVPDFYAPGDDKVIYLKRLGPPASS